MSETSTSGGPVPPFSEATKHEEHMRHEHPDVEDQGKPSHKTAPLFENGVYDNPWPTWSFPKIGHIAKMIWENGGMSWTTPDQEELDRDFPVTRPDMEKLKNPDETSCQMTWIGHATVLVQMDGVNFLTDPIWSKRCSAVQWAGPARYREVPMEIDELPPIDFVLISHSHYDHLDVNTVKKLGNKPVWYVPRGLKEWFGSCGITNVVELSWWEEHTHNEDINVVSLPCQHWSKRTAFDTCKSLWSSWGVLGTRNERRKLHGANNRFFFGGDTGYCSVFKEIGAHYGPFTAAAIPIGAYHPRWFMKPQHVDPYEAVKIHLDIKAQHSLGVHWGTFVLTAEPVLDPPKVLGDAVRRYKLKNSLFGTTLLGETLTVKPIVNFQPDEATTDISALDEPGAEFSFKKSAASSSTTTTTTTTTMTTATASNTSAATSSQSTTAASV